MQMRRLEQKEHIRTRFLYEEAFPGDSRGFVDYYYQEKTKDNIIYAAEEKKEIKAMLHLNPYALMINGREETVHYIVAVATKKEERGRGLMSGLLKLALKEMYQRGEPFTFLMPAAEGIYYPYGFRSVYEQKQEYLTFEEAKERGVKKAEKKESGEIAEFAEGYLREYFQVYAKRDASYYSRLMKEYESDGGYLGVKRKEGEGIAGIYPCVREKNEENPKIMVRIVNLKRFVSLLGLKAPVSACFRATDSILSGNNRGFLLKGSRDLGPCLTEARGIDGEGSVPIPFLNEFFFGKRGADKLFEETKAEAADRLTEELKKIEPLQKIFLNEIV